MKTFEELKQSLSDYLGKDTISLPDSIRGDMINIAQREFTRLSNVRFNEHSDTFTTVASEENYVVPFGYKRPKGNFWYLVGTDREIITYLDKAEFDVEYPEITDASNDDKPVHFTIWAGNLTLGPAPNASYTIHRNYYRILPDLSVGSPNNSNMLIEEAWEVVLFGALKECEAFGFNDERIPLWTSKYEKIRRDIIREYRHSESLTFTNQSAYSR